jgi:hypothetical protein
MVQAYILVQTEVGKAAEVAIRIGETLTCPIVHI